MALRIKNISQTLSVNGAYGLPDQNGASVACGGHGPRPPTCTSPRSFADYLAIVAQGHRQRVEDVINASLAELEAALKRDGFPVDGQAYDIVQTLIVNVRSD